jgi:hypothetical protein
MPRQSKTFKGITIPTTKNEVMDLNLQADVALSNSREGSTRSKAQRGQRLREAARGTQARMAAVMGAARQAKKAKPTPATPESKRNGNVTPSTTTQGIAATKKALVTRTERELKKLDQ